MSGPLSNDNTIERTPVIPDPHGQAAMLLVESLIHMLIAQSVMTVSKAIEVVETALDVTHQMAAELHGEQAAAAAQSALLLVAINKSLRADLLQPLDR